MTHMHTHLFNTLNCKVSAQLSESSNKNCFLVKISLTVRTSSSPPLIATTINQSPTGPAGFVTLGSIHAQPGDIISLTVKTTASCAALSLASFSDAVLIEAASALSPSPSPSLSPSPSPSPSSSDPVHFAGEVVLDAEIEGVAVAEPVGCWVEVDKQRVGDVVGSVFE